MFSLVIPFHSDYQRVIPTLSILNEQSEKWSIKEILLCHNGPMMEAMKALEAYVRPNIKLLHTADKGIGAAYRLGIQNATEQYTILSASDLPFGFSDAKGFLDYQLKQGAYPELAVGSKLHAESDISAYPISRRIFSRIFYLARFVVLGRTTPKDSQGTILGSTNLLQNIVKQVIAQDYFFSLELLSIAIRNGAKLIELPVILKNHDQESSVAPIGDGSAMLFRLFDLRKRLMNISPTT